MEQLTPLENAAGDYAAKYGNENALTRINAFEAGAEWQKEQYKLLCTLAYQAANICDNEGAIELCDKIKTELERLHD